LITFKEFIDKKPLYYKKIDHTRVHQAYSILKPHIKKPLTVHIVGTNGKGSTGRIMATLLHYQNVKVGHFSSPHIVSFNERIWIEGKDIDDSSLENAHKRLYTILGQEMSISLSYFEYTTLLALVAMEKLEVIILEAGLGGEFDATNVVSKDLTVVTPIGLDHQEFLGNTIEEIATTKLNSIEKRAIISFQPDNRVYTLAQKIAKKRLSKLYLLKDLSLNSDILSITETLGWSYYLYENAQLAINALLILSLPFNIQDLKFVNLFGRFYQLAPNITIDVGHNLLAVDAVSKAIESKYGDKKIILVYNSLDDKDYSAILSKLKQYIKRVEIIPIDTNRAIDKAILTKELKRLSIEFEMFKSIKKDEDYLVFGSFFVVESFIKKNLLQI
jgi:dihydrofolate synthase/folylpolyglutamate synthase